MEYERRGKKMECERKKDGVRGREEDGVKVKWRRWSEREKARILLRRVGSFSKQ